MLMTAADVAAIAKPWELQHETAKQVADEFFDQGDMERMQLGINPMWMMDRERKDELPQMQVRGQYFCKKNKYLVPKFLTDSKGVTFCHIT